MAEEGGSNQAGKAPLTDAELARRFDRLERDLATERQERAEAGRPQRSGATDYGAAFRLASEFVAGILVGAALGWALDWFAGTSPWGMIGLLLLGFVAGIVNIVRSAGRVSGAAATKHRGEGDAPL